MGRSVAIELAGKGANVVIVSRTVSKLKEAIDVIRVCKINRRKAENLDAYTFIGFCNQPFSAKVPLR